MRRAALVLSAFLLVASACSPASDETAPTPTPTPSPTIEAGALPEATLHQDDVGDDFEPVDDPTPTTIQIGGRVGPAGFTEAMAEATVAFAEIDGSGFVSNTVYLLDSVEAAEQFLVAHREAEASTWVQPRDQDATATFELVGPIDDLVGIGDNLYTASLAVTIVDAEGNETEREVEYIAYRIDRLLSFVVAQDLEVGALVRRQEQRMAGIVE